MTFPQKVVLVFGGDLSASLNETIGAAGGLTRALPSCTLLSGTSISCVGNSLDVRVRMIYPSLRMKFLNIIVLPSTSLLNWVGSYYTTFTAFLSSAIDELIVIVYIWDFPRMRTDWLAETLVTVT